MKTSSIMKKRMKFFIVTAFFLLIGVVSTYVIFGNSFFGTDAIINDKNIKVTFENGKKGIQFGSYPMTVEEGISSSPSNIFKIVNKGRVDTNYQIRITDTSSDENKIDISKLVVAINDNEVKLLSDVVDGIIYTSSLSSNQENIVNLKFWLDKEHADESDLKKTLKLTVDIKEK